MGDVRNHVGSNTGPNPNILSTIFIASQVNETALRNFFGRFGSIEGILLFSERKYAFIRYMNHFQANQAISKSC